MAVDVLEPIHYSRLAEVAALSPPGRDLDRAVAIEVLGMPPPEEIFGKLGWVSQDGFRELPQFSTDRLAWLDILDEMLREISRWRKSYSMKGGTQFSVALNGRLWSAHFHGYNPFPCYEVPAGQREGVSLPHAICLAALNYAQVAKAKCEWGERKTEDDENEDVDW